MKDEVLSVHAEPSSQSRAPWGSFDGFDPAPMQRGRHDGSAFYPRDLVNLVSSIPAIQGLPPEQAAGLVVETAAHEALEHDYIVSPGLAKARLDSSTSWPNDTGVCTPDEAFRLAGTKARMYGTVPLLSDPEGLWSVNVGRLYDLAVIHFVPRLGWRGPIDPRVCQSPVFSPAARAKLSARRPASSSSWSMSAGQP